MKKCTISLSDNRITVIERYNSRGDLRLKKCQRCGTISQDADVVCGICGTNIANTPSLEGSIEEEILKDQKLREEESRRIRQKIPRESTRELMRRLLPSLLALASALPFYSTDYPRPSQWGETRISNPFLTAFTRKTFSLKQKPKEHHNYIKSPCACKRLILIRLECESRYCASRSFGCFSCFLHDCYSVCTATQSQELDDPIHRFH